MTINDYEAQGGFAFELRKLRDIGTCLVTLEEQIPARPHTAKELQRLRGLRTALNELHDSICRSRALALE